MEEWVMFYKLMEVVKMQSIERTFLLLNHRRTQENTGVN